MSSDVIPDDIARFILEKIDSVAQMEALLLLRNNPEQKWDVATMAKRLYIDEVQAIEVLTRLIQEKLVAESGQPAQCRYEPETPDLRQMVDRLAELYSQHLVPVTNLIHSKPKSRVQEFADAFKFRKDN